VLGFLKRGKFAVVNSLGVHLLTTLSATILNIPYVLHIHTIHLLPLIDRWCLRKARHIVTVSNFSKEFLFRYGVKAENIEVVYNGIDIEELEKKIRGIDLRRELGLDEDTQIVCYAGRIVKWKNLEMLIRVIARVKEDYKGKIKFLFVGDTPKRDIGEPDYKDTLLKLARELGVEDDVIFTGRRKDMADVLKNIDIFAIPSLLEVCSMSILEAMAMGKPVVAMREGGNPELVTEENGILVEPEDEYGLAEAIVRLLRDKEERLNMGLSGRQRVRNFFSIEHNKGKLQETIRCISEKYSVR
jgi:glycosyltransferase involved in cell wall biosynthesis